jgi:tetratricopeptide (TPR) repeat protein
MGQNDALRARLQAIDRARSAGEFSQVAALREEARRRLESLPADAPEFGGLAQSVARLYSSGARTAQARAILQRAADRTTGQARIELLTGIADLWRQDRALRKAVEYLHQAVAAQEAAPSQPTTQLNAAMFVSISGVQSRQVRFFSGRDTNLKNLCWQMAELEQQLGHPAAAAGWHRKLRDMAEKAGGDELALFLQQTGQLAEALALRQSALERAASPEEEASQLQQLAALYLRMGRVDDAVAAQQRAIGRMESVAGEAGRQANGAREWLAQILQQAGRTPQADAVYREVLARAPADDRARLFNNYASYLVSTQRWAQALAVLKEFQESGVALKPWEESSMYRTMSNAAAASGNARQAGEFHVRAEAASRQGAENVTLVRPQLDTLLGKAQAAAGAGKIDDAMALAMQALGIASNAPNREQIGWAIPPIVSLMASRKAEVQGDQLYQRALSLAESWSDEGLQPLLTLLSNQMHYLIAQPRGASQALDVIERYRSLLVEAHGADSGTLDDPMRMLVQFERTRHPAPASLIPAQDLVAFEESINGDSSEPYLRAMQTLAESYDFNGDRRLAIEARRQIVELADLIYPEGDHQRVQARRALTLALAKEGESAEAGR